MMGCVMSERVKLSGSLWCSDFSKLTSNFSPPTSYYTSLAGYLVDTCCVDDMLSVMFLTCILLAFMTGSFQLMLFYTTISADKTSYF